ncbi:hypothetical protein RB195_026014 [Necator americanus]|uniref:Uncharacterized protein n=1 Tax=Necator americanus TaxID=51031 RepID=A0ABR1EVF0_NECAM
MRVEDGRRNYVVLPDMRVRITKFVYMVFLARRRRHAAADDLRGTPFNRHNSEVLAAEKEYGAGSNSEREWRVLTCSTGTANTKQPPQCAIERRRRSFLERALSAPVFFFSSPIAIPQRTSAVHAVLMSS